MQKNVVYLKRSSITILNQENKMLVEKHFSNFNKSLALLLTKLKGAYPPKKEKLFKSTSLKSY